MNIYDISKKAGVSTATVSRVLNGLDSVKPATKDKVLKVIEEENYRPNAFARGLSTGSGKLAGIVCTDVSDAFFAKAVSILQKLLRQRGYTVMLSCTGDEMENKKLQLCYMLEKNVDAIYLIGSSFNGDKNSDYLINAAKTTPLIMINGKSSTKNTYSVYCDEKRGICNATELLADNGYKKILYIYDRLTPSGKDKLQGYKNALKAKGILYDNALILKTEKSIDGARISVAKLLDSGILPDSAIASEDILAIGVLKECQNRGISVPIIGHNNSQLCHCTTPTLSSIDNKLEIMCSKGAEIMDKILSGNEIHKKEKIEAELILRESFKGDIKNGNY